MYYINIYIIYLFRMAQLNTVYIKIYSRFIFSEVLIHTNIVEILCIKINVKHVLTTLYRVLQQAVLLAAYRVVIPCLYLIVNFMF